VTAALVASLAPLISRVRTDVTARKSDDGRQSWSREALTEKRLLAHVLGGTARGVSQIQAGESTTRVAVLDFDSHGGTQDDVDWEAMSAVVLRVVDVLELGWGLRATLWRSSGGRGVHAYYLWDEPQDAYSVREVLRRGLEACGLKSGAGGVSQGAVEIFPKQNEVSADGYGNQVIVPLSGKSVPLETVA
jgi:hypothetical protein